jgi:polysaccharide export outer membrane protein
MNASSRAALGVTILLATFSVEAARAAEPAPRGAAGPAAAGTVAPGYVIGTDDVLHVVFWRDKDLTAEVVVRPDGMISLPLLRDIQAAGLAPEQLGRDIAARAERYLQDPNVTVVVRQINSRRVFITGQVEKSGFYPLTSPMTVVQLLALAGGLREYADGKDIIIMRQGGETLSFNYEELVKRRNLAQNVALKPGDTVIVP